MRASTAEELFYMTRNTSRSISTLMCVSVRQRSSTIRQEALVGVERLLCVVVLQKSSSIREGAPIGENLPCCV